MVASTLRMPEELHQRLRAWARQEGRSVNDLALQILEREARRWSALQLLAEAERRGEEFRARHGALPDSTLLVRQLREERDDRG